MDSVHRWTVGWCIMYTRIKLLVLIYSFIKISSIFFLSSSKTWIFCHTFLWGIRSWNLIHTWEMGWSVVYTKIKQQVHTCSFIFLLFSISQISKHQKLACTKLFNYTSDGYGRGYVSFAHYLLYFRNSTQPFLEKTSIGCREHIQDYERSFAVVGDLFAIQWSVVRSSGWEYRWGLVPNDLNGSWALNLKYWHQGSVGKVLWEVK